MHRKPYAALALAISITTGILIAPAPAGADVFDQFLRLSERHLSPPPLVPVSAPPPLSPLNEHIGQISSPNGKKSYLFRMTRAKSKLVRPDTVIALERGVHKSMAEARREGRRLAFRIKPTKVRGRRGYLFTRVFGVRLWELTWVEDGQVYTISTGTTKTISLKQLRATATALEHLGREYIGSVYDRDRGDQSAIVVTTEKTVSANIEWSGQCTLPDGTIMSPRGGSTELALIAKQGSTFSFAVAPGSPAGNVWTASGSGTVGPNAATLNFRATAAIEGLNCDSGPVALTLDQRAQG